MSDTTREIAFWAGRIKSVRDSARYTKYREDRGEAIDFYRGQMFKQEDVDNWGGDLVEANLFHRHVNFMTNAVYSKDPAIRASARRKLRKDPNAAEMSGSVETHLTYTFEELSLGGQIRRVWKDSYFGNIAAAKVVFDKKRGLWGFKRVWGEVVIDPHAHGDISQAQWVAEQVILPKYRVWQDAAFDPEARKELKGKHSGSVEGSVTTTDDDEQEEKRSDCETLWYIYTREGVMPHLNEDAEEHVKLLVMCEGLDQWLSVEDDPCPYLDHDEFPIFFCVVDEDPDDIYGVAPWRIAGSLCKAFNWSASYLMEDMRKTAMRPIGYDEDRVDDISALEKREHMPLIGTQGPPKECFAPIDMGSTDKTMYDTTLMYRDLLDKVTGVDEVARGEEGRTKTATESQLLNENSSITMRGPGLSLDEFIKEGVRRVGLASLYYIPAWSVYVNDAGFVVTRMPQQQPMMDQMLGGPMMDPETGQMQMETIIVEVAPELEEEQIEEFKVKPVPGGYMAGPDRKGDYLIKGIDYFHDDETALSWPQIPFEQVKCDLQFQIEAGSTRASRRAEKQRTAQNLQALVGEEYKQAGLWDEYWEVLNTIIDSFELPDRDRFIPPKEEFVQNKLLEQKMMMQMGIPSSGQGGSKAKPGDPNANENAGKSFPAR